MLPSYEPDLRECQGPFPCALPGRATSYRLTLVSSILPPLPSPAPTLRDSPGAAEALRPPLVSLLHSAPVSDVV